MTAQQQHSDEQQDGRATWLRRRRAMKQRLKRRWMGEAHIQSDSVDTGCVYVFDDDTTTTKCDQAAEVSGSVNTILIPESHHSINYNRERPLLERPR